MPDVLHCSCFGVARTACKVTKRMCPSGHELFLHPTCPFKLSQRFSIPTSLSPRKIASVIEQTPKSSVRTRPVKSPRGIKTPRLLSSTPEWTCPVEPGLQPCTSSDPSPPDPHWEVQAGLYWQGMGPLLGSLDEDMKGSSGTDLVKRWVGHLNTKGATQLSFFLAESPARLEWMRLAEHHSRLGNVIGHLVHPEQVPSSHDWHDTLTVQTWLLEEGLCPLDAARMATWLRQVHECLTRPAASPRSAADLALLLRLLGAITRNETFVSQGWLGGRAEGLALRHAVAGLMLDLNTIVERCPDLTGDEREWLAQCAAEVRL